MVWYTPLNLTFSSRSLIGFCQMSGEGRTKGEKVNIKRKIGGRREKRVEGVKSV